MSDTIDTSAFRFRTAVGGFNKGDVANYITKTAAAHRAEVEEYKSRLAQMEELNESLTQELAALTLSLETTQMPREEPVPQDISSMELAAYRRAEAAERLANQRAKKLYEALENICRDTENDFSLANDAVQQTVESILSQAKFLENACKQLSDALKDSREKLSSMDAMIPDPAEDMELELCGN